MGMIVTEIGTEIAKTLERKLLKHSASYWSGKKINYVTRRKELTPSVCYKAGIPSVRHETL